MEKRLISKKPTWVRYLKEIKDVIYDKEWLKSAKNFPVYYVWRGVKGKGELRYDITVISPKMLGKEFPKTKGHCHLGKFPELITVLKGRGYYFFQKGKSNKATDVYVIPAKKGEWLIAPPHYCHITVNPTKKRLVMANWVSEKCRSDYSLFEKYQGGAYYFTKEGWLKNKKYKKVPKLRFKKTLKKAPKNLDFLYGN